MTRERQRIAQLFEKLCSQAEFQFPQRRKPLNAPSKHGVYIIRKAGAVLHVGRTTTRKDGLRGRMKEHLHGNSSFVKKHLKGQGAKLREKGYSYQFLVVEKRRARALLEAYAIGTLCPRHIG